MLLLYRAPVHVQGRRCYQQLSGRRSHVATGAKKKVVALYGYNLYHQLLMPAILGPAPIAVMQAWARQSRIGADEGWFSDSDEEM